MCRPRSHGSPLDTLVKLETGHWKPYAPDMHCANCGGDQPDLNFCPSCGTPIAPVAASGGSGIGVGSVVVLVASFITFIFLFIQTHPRIEMPFRLPRFLREDAAPAQAIPAPAGAEPTPAVEPPAPAAYVLAGRTSFTSGSTRIEDIALQLAEGKDWKDVEALLVADLTREAARNDADVVRLSVYDAATPPTVREPPAALYVWYDPARAGTYPDPAEEGFTQLSERVYRKP